MNRENSVQRGGGGNEARRSVAAVVRACAAALVVASFGCSEENASPTAPTAMAPAAETAAAPRPEAAGAALPETAGAALPEAAGAALPEAAGASAALPTGGDCARGGTGLKATPPQPLRPVGGAVITDRTPLLEAANARACFVSAAFEHEFVLFRVDGGSRREVVRGNGRRMDGERASFQAPATLDAGARYAWQVRAHLDGVYGPWSSDGAFRVAASTSTPPQPLAPRNGQTDVATRPQFTVRNADFRGRAGTARVEVAVATDAAVTRVVARGSTHQRDRGETNIPIDRALQAGTQYYWRARARLGSAVTEWSAVWRFTTARPSAGPTTGPPRGRCCPPPNRFDIVQAILRRTGDLFRRDMHAFTQRVAECLAVTDGDWGRRRNDSGTIGLDTVAYRTTRGPGHGPYSIDIMRGARSNNPVPHWQIQSHDGIDGRVGGRWIPVNGRGCILGSVR